MKSCFFIGHRESPIEILPMLINSVEQHITNYSVMEFIVGNYGAFDRLAAKAVVFAKKRHPEIILSLLIPYHPTEHHVEIPPEFDNTFYSPGMEKIPRRYAIIRANRYMVDHTDYLIAYARHPASNARNLVAYALRKNIPTTNLGDDPIIP